MYDYEKEKRVLFTDRGQREFLKVRDKAKQLLAESGAVLAEKLLDVPRLGTSWENMTCIDRLVELGELREIKTNGAWQHRVFVKGNG